MGGDFKRTALAFSTGGISEVARKGGEELKKIADPGRGAREQQAQDIARQKQTEGLRLAEEESEIGRRRVLATRGAGGRASLIATSRRGLTANLGGS
jgi:hypothetical protein